MKLQGGIPILHVSAFRWLIRCLLTVWLSGMAVAATAQQENNDSENELPLAELQIFTEVFEQIKSQYVDQVEDLTLLRDAIHGMLAGLDPHSLFLDPEAYAEMQISADGQFSGIGVELNIADGLVKVVTPLDDTPAYRAGLQAGDIILKLDGVATQGMQLRDVVERVRGPAGSKIVLTISRPSEVQNEIFAITLVRTVIKVVSVKSEMLEDGFAYVRITSFKRRSGANLRSQLEKLQRKNQGLLDGIVLDLRNNPGGTLHSAVEVSDKFLSEGVIVYTRGRTPQANYSFGATTEDITKDTPLVVLVNGGSASAAEIVAGALQDHNRALIIGTKTFGKGSVQTVIPIQSGGALKITTARYYTPLERSIQARGIDPDIIVEPTRPSSEQSEQSNESKLLGHLKSDYKETKRDKKSASTLLAQDYQLSVALNLLKGMSLVKFRSDNSPLPTIEPPPNRRVRIVR